MLYFGLGMSF